MMSKVGVTRRGNVDGDADRNEGEDEKIGRRRSYGGIWGGGCLGDIVFGRQDLGMRAGSWWWREEKGYRDGEFGAQEER